MAEEPAKVAEIVDGTHTRSNVNRVIKLLEAHGARGIPLPQALTDALPHVVAKLLRSDSPRIQNSGAKLMLAIARHNLELVELADKMARLDEAKPTELTSMPIKLIGVDPRALE